MNKDEASESLLILIGELLHKNLLLREAIASKDEAIELIISHLMNASTSACSCGVANHLTFVRNTVNERDLELARRKMYCVNEFCNIAKYLIDSAASSPWDAVIRAEEKQRLTPIISAVSHKCARPNMAPIATLFEGGEATPYEETNSDENGVAQ